MGEKDGYIVKIISGGHGKSIAATAVIEAIKKQYPERKIIVVSAWIEPFFQSPHIYRFYRFNELNNYFYDDYIKDKDTIIFQHDPYHSTDYILKKKHLIEIWCDLCGVKYNGEQPKLYLNDREREIVRDKIKPQLGKPILALQSNGGLVQNQYSKKSWARDIPLTTAQQVVNHYSSKYRILHIRLENQPVLQNVEPLTLPLREIYACLELSQKRLMIDSFAQHASSALNLPSAVCWIINKPEILGYKIHTNIFPNQEIKREMNKFSFLEEYNITGEIHEFPFDSVELFDTQDIINAVDGL